MFSTARSSPARFSTVRTHPEYPALAVSLLSWILIIGIHASGGEGPGPGLPMNSSPRPGMSMPGMSMNGMGMDDMQTSWDMRFWGLPLWVLMCVATMIPAALPAVRHVAVNSLRWRRQRAITGFLVAYLGAWTAFGLVALPLLTLVERALPRWSLIVATTVFAVVWQVLPPLVTFRRRCHQTVPLPLRGWPAHAGCLRFGLRHGLACLGVCGPLMLLMALLLHAHQHWMVLLLWMILLSTLVLAAKLAPRRWRPRVLSFRSAPNPRPIPQPRTPDAGQGLDELGVRGQLPFHRLHDDLPGEIFHP